MSRTHATMVAMAVCTLIVVSMLLLNGFWIRNQTASSARANCKLHRVHVAECRRAFPRSPLIP